MGFSDYGYGDFTTFAESIHNLHYSSRSIDLKEGVEGSGPPPQLFDRPTQARKKGRSNLTEEVGVSASAVNH